MTMQSINPATDELIAVYPEDTFEGINVRLQMAEEAFRIWQATSFGDRSSRLWNLARILQQEADRMACLMTQEMGKPIRQARAEVEKCAWVCEFYADHAHEFLHPRPESTDAERSYVRFDPVGSILAIMPWNFPFWQVFRCAVPGVMAGNVIVLKHASNVCGVAQEIERLFIRAEFPTGVFTTLLLNSEQTDDLIGHRQIQAVTLTGSDRAGRVVAKVAGKHLKPTVLELGGSDPFIALADTDPQYTAKRAVQARCQNNGQSCIAAKRFLVEQPIAEEFISSLVEEMQRLTVGDPLDEEIDIGPLARPDLRDTLQQQVVRSLEQGAELNCGGKPIAGCGNFYPPTVLTNVRPGMAAFDEETFGPVAAVTVVESAEEAISLANRSAYGLGASLWTDDTKRAEELAQRLDTGCVFINEIVKSDPHLPFGGVKQSGYGRELSREGIQAFVNVKSVWVA